MVRLTGGAIAGIGAIAALGALAYALHKGLIKLPDLGTAAGTAVTNIIGDLGFPDVAKGLGEGFQEAGLAGAAGGGLTELYRPGDQTVSERYQELIKDPITKDWIKTETGIETPTIAQIQTRAAMQTAAETTTTGPFGWGATGALLPVIGAPFTIGAGFAAIEKEKEYKETLLPWQQYDYEMEAWTRRSQYLYSTEGRIMSLLSFGVAPVLQATLWKPEKPAGYAEQKAAYQERQRTIEAQTISTIQMKEKPMLGSYGPSIDVQQLQAEQPPPTAGPLTRIVSKIQGAGGQVGPSTIAAVEKEKDFREGMAFQ